MNKSALKATSATDWARVSAQTDAEIDTSEIPLLDEGFFASARLRLPARPLTEVTLHLDPHVVDWFKAQGSAYEQLINAALRIYVQAHSTYAVPSPRQA